MKAFLWPIYSTGGPEALVKTFVLVSLVLCDPDYENNNCVSRYGLRHRCSRPAFVVVEQGLKKPRIPTAANEIRALFYSSISRPTATLM